MSVRLKVTYEDGSQDELKFRVSKRELEINFSEIGGRGKERKRVAGIDLSPLSSISSLMSFRILNGRFETIDLSPLGSCRKLQTLEIVSSDFTSVDLSSLAGCSNLRRLQIGYRPFPVNLNHLRSFPHLEELVIGSVRIKKIDLSPLSGFQELTLLSIDFRYLQAIDLTPLSSCPNLQRLIINCRSLGEIDLTPLSSISKLSELAIYAREEPPTKGFDLSPLSSCVNLKQLDLYYNRLGHIDLSPLGGLTELRSLRLQNNDLKNIDLSPLRSCPNLERLDIADNHLTDVDLTPLGACTNLEDLLLSRNKLESVDLSPLRSCPRLALLSIEIPSLRDIDLSPLAACSNFGSLYTNWGVDITPLIIHPSFHSVRKRTGHIESWIQDPFPERDLRTFIKIDPPSPDGSWELLHRLANIPQGMSISIQSYILKVLELENFGFIDSDISEFLCSISSETSIENARELVRAYLVNKVCEQIDRGGTTIGLDVQALMNEFGEIAMRVPRIAELRDSEMNELEAKFFERHSRYYRRPEEYSRRPEGYSLHPIYLTTYGFSILRRMILENRYYASKEEFSRIQRAVEELGYKLTVCDAEEEYEPELHQPKNMSMQMKYYILGIVRHITVQKDIETLEALMKGIKVPQLRKLLKQHNLSSKGRKRQLALRLIDEVGWATAAEVIEKHTKHP